MAVGSQQFCLFSFSTKNQWWWLLPATKI